MLNSNRFDGVILIVIFELQISTDQNKKPSKTFLELVRQCQGYYDCRRFKERKGGEHANQEEECFKFFV